ncbi:MAG: CDP-alcohol phosphatidyltransferase family protein [Chloroflexota bacterium]
MPDLQTARYALRGAVSNWFERPAVALLVALKVNPTMATIIGMVIAVIAGYFVYTGDFVLGGILVLVGATFDMLDGGIARSTNSVSKRGALTDSVFDRVSELAVLAGLGVYYANQIEDSTLGVTLAFLASGGSILVSYVRARAEGLGAKGTAGFLTRPERVVITVIGLILGYPMAVLWILGVGTPLSALWRYIEAWKAIGDSD